MLDVSNVLLLNIEFCSTSYTLEYLYCFFSNILLLYKLYVWFWFYAGLCQLPPPLNTEPLEPKDEAAFKLHFQSAADIQSLT